MNGGGGHEDSVTSALAEAERGMLVHCCCFVVNLVRGYRAARLPPFYQLCQRSPPPGQDHYSTTFFFLFFLHKYPRSQRWGSFFSPFPPSLEDVLTFLSKLLEFSRWHFGAGWLAGRTRPPWSLLYCAFFCLFFKVHFSNLFGSCGHVLRWRET